MKQGDIILVPFPFTDLSSQKTRPALVISKKKGQDIIVCAITSKKSEEAFQIDSSDLQQGKLPLTSFVKYHKVVTLHEALIKRIVGHLKPTIFKQIMKKFFELFH